MTDPELLQILDYILNRSDSASIEALAEAVVRRRRNLSLFNTVSGTPDPQKTAKDITKRINAGISGGIENMRMSIQEMIVNILKENAPELNNKQINELCQACLPEPQPSRKGEGSPLDETGTNKETSGNFPPNIFLSMIEQFVSFSRGEMNESVDKNLREEIGEWPGRYWKSFPTIVQQTITDYLKNKITEKDYKSRIILALGL